MRTPRDVFDAITDRFVRWLDRVAEDGFMRLAWWKLKAWFGYRMVERKLVVGEKVIDDVTHSKILYLPWALLAIVGLVLAIFWLPNVPESIGWFAILLVTATLGYAFFKFLYISRDRFVVTDSRVFRVWGVFTLHEAEMEIVRLLDVTVVRPWFLRPFGAGHLVLENAAQEQGLRDIRYIPRPENCALVIHRRRREMSGLGAPDPDLDPDHDSEPGAKKSNPRRPDHPRSPGPVTARRR